MNKFETRLSIYEINSLVNMVNFITNNDIDKVSRRRMFASLLRLLDHYGLILEDLAICDALRGIHL